MMLAAPVISPASSLDSSPLLQPSSPSDPLDVDLDLDIDADMHSVAPFSLSPAPSTSSAASSAGSHPPSPYQLPQRVYPLRASSSTLNSSPSLSAFSPPTAQHAATAAARHVCALHHSPVHHHQHHIHYTQPTAPANSAAAPYKATAVLGTATPPQYNPPSSPPTPSYVYMQAALPMHAPPSLSPPARFHAAAAMPVTTTLHSTHTQYTLTHPTYHETAHRRPRDERHNGHYSEGVHVRVKREPEAVTEEVEERTRQPVDREEQRSGSKRKKVKLDESEQPARPAAKPRPKLHVSTSSTSLHSSSSSSVTSPHSAASPSALIFVCSDCPRRFTRNSNLTRHKRIHSGQRRFTCHECSKGFMEKHHLTAHMRTHTGEKPYKCPQCPRQFTDRSNCSRHIRTHGLSPLGTDSEADEQLMAEAEEAEAEDGQGDMGGGEGKGQLIGNVMRVRTKMKVEVEDATGGEAKEHERAALPNSIEVSAPASSDITPTADKAEEAQDVHALGVRANSALLATPTLQTLQASPQMLSSVSPQPMYVVELRGRKDSLEPFNLAVGAFQSPLLSAGTPSSPGRRSSYPFALSPAFPSASSPAMQLLSVSLSPALPPSVLLSGGSRCGLIGEASPAPRVYSIASTMAAMTSSPSPASLSLPSQSADAGLSLLDVSSPSAARSLAVSDVTAPSPRTHHAATSLLSAANDAQSKHSGSQQAGASKANVSASEHLQALFHKVTADKQQSALD